MDARIRTLIFGLSGLVLAGCASTPPSPEALAANDPYEQTNRQTLVLNGKIDRYFVGPHRGGLFRAGARCRPARGP